MLAAAKAAAPPSNESRRGDRAHQPRSRAILPSAGVHGVRQRTKSSGSPILRGKPGVDGIVCSGAEVACSRAVWPDGFFVVPGVRPAGGDVGDQKRVVTPAQALADGASVLVIGRPITDAADPGQATIGDRGEPDPLTTEARVAGMSWLSRVRSGIPFLPKRQTAENLWHKCGKCGTMVFVKEWEENYSVCPRCNFHDRIGPPKRFRAAVRRRRI